MKSGQELGRPVGYQNYLITIKVVSYDNQIIIYISYTCRICQLSSVTVWAQIFSHPLSLCVNRFVT